MDFPCTVCTQTTIVVVGLLLFTTTAASAQFARRSGLQNAALLLGAGAWPSGCNAEGTATIGVRDG